MVSDKVKVNNDLRRVGATLRSASKLEEAESVVARQKKQIETARTILKKTLEEDSVYRPNVAEAIAALACPECGGSERVDNTPFNALPEQHLSSVPCPSCGGEQG